MRIARSPVTLPCVGAYASSLREWHTWTGTWLVMHITVRWRKLSWTPHGVRRAWLRHHHPRIGVLSTFCRPWSLESAQFSAMIDAHRLAKVGRPALVRSPATPPTVHGGTAPILTRRLLPTMPRIPSLSLLDSTEPFSPVQCEKQNLRFVHEHKKNGVFLAQFADFHLFAVL